MSSSCTTTSTPVPVVEIDGSYLEGGGQILRNAVVFSCLTGRPVRVTKIRANRPEPGLRPSHLEAISLVRDLAGAELIGGEVGSSTITFLPGRTKCFAAEGMGVMEGRCGTAGSITLMLQASLLPALAFGVSCLKMTGGTDVDFSPPFDHYQDVLFPLFEKLFGFRVGAEIGRRGVYPRGGGAVQVGLSSRGRGNHFPLPAFALDFQEDEPQQVVEGEERARVVVRAFGLGHLSAGKQWLCDRLLPSGMAPPPPSSVQPPVAGRESTKIPISKQDVLASSFFSSVSSSLRKSMGALTNSSEPLFDDLFLGISKNGVALELDLDTRACDGFGISVMAQVAGGPAFFGSRTVSEKELKKGGGKGKNKGGGGGRGAPGSLVEDLWQKACEECVGTGTGWLIRIGPVSDRFQTGVRPVPCRMHSPCHSVSSPMHSPCHHVMSDAQSCRMHRSVMSDAQS